MEIKMDATVAEGLVDLIPDKNLKEVEKDQIYTIGSLDKPNVKIYGIRDQDGFVIYCWTKILDQEFEYGTIPECLK